ncbi:MAG: glycoside hydrolase family 3 C-terminal domain-containing protein [Acidobacteria bacterium]|nr:glycoside hydrolase family 3 C-terminal domain-containing protein [Acidobacteriota bacterium]
MRQIFSRIVSFILLTSLLTTTLVAQRRNQPNVEAKINALIARMTLAEKLGQLQQLDGDFPTGAGRPEHFEMVKKGLLGSTLNVRGAKNVNELQRAAMQSRLKIPHLFAFDVIHGYRTIFPVPLGEAASFDPKAAEMSSYIAAKESRAAGVAWTFAPMVDIARDPRWGRIVEGAGEDTYLGAQFAAARVRGFQGPDYSRPDRVLACAKHWVAYGAAQAGRDYNTTDISENTLYNVYFPPFKAAKDAGVDTFMSSFNSLNGIPATADRWTLTDVLRNQWKFDGFVVSDYTSVMELVNHGYARDEADAAQLALNAGLDMEMVSRFMNQNGEKLVKEKKLSMATIDEAVRRILRIKFRLGLFDNPYTDESLEAKTLLAPEHRKAAREIAAESFVLLKNDNQTLPVRKNVKELAVVGALADSKEDILGSWNGDGKAADAVTVLEGIKNKLGPNTKIRYAPGCDAKCEDTSGFDKALDAVRDSDFTILVLGESAGMSGEASSRSDIDLPGRQLELVRAVAKTGKPYAVVLMNGRPLTINWLAENSPAILETWFAGTEGGNAVADVLFGDVNPSGKLPVTFPRSVGQIPLFYNQPSTGRPFDANNKYTSKYLDVPNTPLYPFGYGLSYTKFQISNLRLSAKQIAPNGSLTVTADVENTGAREGTEVVQLYIRDLVGSIVRPVKELKGFERVTLKAGEKRAVTFTLKPEQLGFYNAQNKFVVEPGDFRVWVGQSSADGLEGSFTVK